MPGRPISEAAPAGIQFNPTAYLPPFCTALTILPQMFASPAFHTLGCPAAQGVIEVVVRLDARGDDDHVRVERLLRTWNDFRCDYYVKEYNFMRHTLSYTGDNNLADAILAVEREKYKCHIRQELYDDPKAMELIMSGINYMIYGNIGLLKENYGSLRSSITKVSAYYQLAWDMMQNWMPQIVRNSMEHEPVRAIDTAALPFAGR